MVFCFFMSARSRDQKNFVSPENYGDWRSARSRSSFRNQPVCRVQLKAFLGNELALRTMIFGAGVGAGVGIGVGAGVGIGV